MTERYLANWGLFSGAQGRNRTTDTRIFSRQLVRFVNWINELKLRNQSVLRSVLWIWCKPRLNCPDRFMFSFYLTDYVLRVKWNRSCSRTIIRRIVHTSPSVYRAYWPAGLYPCYYAPLSTGKWGPFSCSQFFYCYHRSCCNAVIPDCSSIDCSENQ